MRIIIIALLFTLSGCESLGEVIREKKYTVQIHETPNTKQSFGYDDDYDYVGYIVTGRFGNAPAKHEHSINCEHNIKKPSE